MVLLDSPPAGRFWRRAGALEPSDAGQIDSLDVFDDALLRAACQLEASRQSKASPGWQRHRNRTSNLQLHGEPMLNNKSLFGQALDCFRRSLSIRQSLNLPEDQITSSRLAGSRQLNPDSRPEVSPVKKADAKETEFACSSARHSKAMGPSLVLTAMTELS